MLQSRALVKLKRNDDTVAGLWMSGINLYWVWQDIARKNNSGINPQIARSKDTFLGKSSGAK
jgi:hypothetical protein